MGQTKRLAQFAAELEYPDLPSPVIEKAKEIALHSWGLQLAGSTLPWSKMAYRYVRSQGGVPQSTVVNYGLKTSTSSAAFANGAFGNSFELDDNHAASGIKGGGVVVPASLAIAERQLSTGKEFILAAVAAYEVMLRIGLSVNCLTQVPQPHHPTSICGPFGAATAVGKLLRFDEKTMAHAIGVAAAHHGGLMEAPPTGWGHLKRIFAGMAASNGVRSALLAREGLTAPEGALEGEAGFCRAFGGDAANLAALTAGLGTEWQILRVHYKIWAQDGYIQPMTEALERIVKQHNLSPEQIEEVRVGTNRHAHDQIVGVIREPKDLTSAQFSTNFSLALLLVKGGAGFSDYTEESLIDPRIIDLSRRIHTEVDDEVDREWQATKARGARVSVRLRSGATHSESVSMLRAMTAEDVNEKFLRLASVVLAPEQGERLVTLARNMDSARDLARIILLLTASTRA